MSDSRTSPTRETRTGLERVHVDRLVAELQTREWWQWWTLGHRPPAQLPEFVAWKLRLQPDSFYARLLRAVQRADEFNRAKLRRVFPELLEAFDAWEAGEGDFQLPAASIAVFGEGRQA